ncbi:FHA domain-containing protein [Cellvibrio fontiphilus]|uniref:FHA domain-containing protein n=1 Tax=Cellvibrio fontiphilus TaxID=1815559 RepID=A0ABV7FI69_9GAMM|nr:FHA domain-containing protein [Cellvibrio fontiphilus]
MSRPVFIELLTPDGEVLHRHKHNQLPIRIGRAYDNDIILDDPHTAAHHAQIELNQLDELIISDLDSFNGITRANSRERFFVVDGDAVYRLGHTRLRIRTPDYQVAAEQTDFTNHRWEGLLPATVGLLLLLTTGLLTTWLSDLNQGSLGKYLLELVSVFGFALGWSGIWAIFSKLFSGHARFGRHLFIVSLCLTGLEVWDYLSSMLAYAFSWEVLAHFTVHPLIFICAIALYFHLRTAGNKKPGRLKFYLLALALAGTGISMTKQYQASNHLGDALYLSQLYPPALRISRDVSLAELMSNIDELQATVDADRKESSEKNESNTPAGSVDSADTSSPGTDTPDQP